MSRPKSHESAELHPGFWCNCLLDDFIEEAEGGSPPESWGGNVTQRYANAAFVAWVSATPTELEIPEEMGDGDQHPDAHYTRQVTFTRLFTLAPDYFISLVRYVRSRRLEGSQIDTVARALNFDGNALTHAGDGSLRTDKEIADVLEKRRELKLRGLHSSVVGKARKRLDELKKRMALKQAERYVEAGSEAMLKLARLVGRPGTP